MSFRLQVISHIWNKESNSLFDYDSHDVTSSKVEISKNGCILKGDNKTILYKNTNDTKAVDKNHNYLSSIHINHSGNEFQFKIEESLYIHSTENTKIISDNWIVTRQSILKSGLGYKLRESDIIKLGKVIFRVKEVCVIAGFINTNMNTNHNNIMPRLGGLKR